MSARLYERVFERNGYKYLKLKSGRLVTFWDMRRAAEHAETELMRAVSRAFKLADDYDLERLEWFVWRLQSHLQSVQDEIEKRRGVRTQEERIALLRNTTGRSPAEAEAFRRKADQLEAAMTQP